MHYELSDGLRFNFPVQGNFDVIRSTKNLEFESVLDVGFGQGGASIYFALNGKSVTAIGLDIDSYNYPSELLNRLGVNVVDASLETFNLEKKFDAIWASHVLEHSLNTGHFLQKCRELLSDGGWLFLMVPPYKSQVVGGHVNTGWNIGQLMYNLLLCGFDIKNGHFKKHGYNLCAFVRKTNQTLPLLRMDAGDIEATKDYWPIDVYQGFEGDVSEVNWFSDFENYENLKLENQKLKDEILSLKGMAE